MHTQTHRCRKEKTCTIHTYTIHTTHTHTRIHTHYHTYKRYTLEEPARPWCRWGYPGSWPRHGRNRAAGRCTTGPACTPSTAQAEEGRQRTRVRCRRGERQDGGERERERRKQGNGRKTQTGERVVRRTVQKSRINRVRGVHHPSCERTSSDRPDASRRART